jgi:UDP-N-acetylmuramate--alanine ligase
MNRRFIIEDHVKHIHCVGIGGIGVSALVPELLKRGYTVSGSDPAENEATERLKNMGVKITHTHSPENTEGADLIVATAAVKEDHVEIAAAKQNGIPVWHRAQMLGYLMQDKKSLIVSGAHGKTTVTAMIAVMLEECGFDPSVYAGGEIPAFHSNAKTGNGGWAVAEGDESDGSFTNFSPDIAIVNNIDADHLDHYKSIDAVIEQFEAFLSNTKDNGWILLSADCKHSSALKNKMPNQNYVTYGFDTNADIRGTAYCRNGVGWRCDVVVDGEMQGVLHMPISGIMNYHNAMAALAAAKVLGIPFNDASTALSKFTGVKRRMEAKGIINNIHVFDDYAHHPEEIKATVEAFRERADGRLIGVFQPHLYSRTQQLLTEFSQAFHGLDLAVITGIYASREKFTPSINSEMLVKLLRQNNVPVVFIPNKHEIASFLASAVEPGDTLVTMGAGDIWKTGEELLTKIGGRYGA